MATPDSYVTHPDAAASMLAGLRAGDVVELGRSYADRDIHRQIVETYMTAFETVLEIGVHGGFRPPV